MNETIQMKPFCENLVADRFYRFVAFDYESWICVVKFNHWRFISFFLENRLYIEKIMLFIVVFYI